jgi:hypothetical protein
MSKICILVDCFHSDGTAANDSSYGAAVTTVANRLTSLGVPLSMVSHRYATVSYIRLVLTSLFRKGAELVLSDYYGSKPMSNFDPAMQKTMFAEALAALKKCYVCGEAQPVITSYVNQLATNTDTIEAIKSLGCITKVSVVNDDIDYAPVSISDATFADYMAFFSELKNGIDSGADLVVRFSSKNAYYSKPQMIDALAAFVIYAKSQGSEFVQYRDF